MTLNISEAPWHRDDPFGEEGGMYIAAADTSLVAKVYGNSIAETRANADLLSAAPDLLAGCEQMLHVLEGEEEDESFDWVRNAIRKAKGEPLA